MCCQPPPMSQRQAEKIAQIIGPRPSLASLAVWELTLTCGHITRRTAHRDNRRYSVTTDCEECGGEPRGVIAQVNIGPADEVARQEAAARTTRTPKAAQTAVRLKLLAAEREARAAKERAAALRIQLAQMEAPPPAATDPRGDRGAGRA
jgi:hypothetical protein